MTESIDYDLGYFEAMRNAVVAAIQCHMNGMEIGDIIKHLAQLREVGKSKYGVTMETSPISRLEWLIHAQEEAMDLAVYLQKLIEMEVV